MKDRQVDRGASLLKKMSFLLLFYADRSPTPPTLDGKQIAHCALLKGFNLSQLLIAAGLPDCQYSPPKKYEYLTVSSFKFATWR